MVIYEVNLTIDDEIFYEYKHWLDEHIQEMLQLPGFLNATMMRPSMDDELPDHTKRLTIQYQIATSQDLKNYLEIHAPTMRGDGIKHFKDRFTATRRIFEVL